MRFKVLLNAVLLILVLAGCRDSAEQVNNAPAEVGAPGVSALNIDDDSLSAEERKHLWDVEHAGFVIERTVFKELKSALKSGDLAAWDAYLSPECEVHLLDMSEEAALAQTAVQHGEVPGSANQRIVSVAEFQEWLTELRSRFGTEDGECGASMGLVRMMPDSREDPETEWTSRWRLRLSGVKDGTATEAVCDFVVHLNHFEEEISTKQNWIESLAVEDFRIVSAPEKLFEENLTVSAQFSKGLYDNWDGDCKFEPNTGGVYLADYNNDGNLDVLVDDLKAGARLFKGNGDGTFNDETEQANLGRPEHISTWALSCWGDFDSDGDSDVIIEDRIYENLGDGTFRDITKQCGLLITPAAGYAVGDYDLDGDVDLYVCHTGAYRIGQSTREKVSWIDSGLGIDNVLWRNDGNWQFTDVTKETGTGGEGSSCFAAVFLDANMDGRPDIFAINEFGKNSLLLNQADGTFQSETIDPVFGGFSMGVTAGDFNNDGRTDIYVSNMYSKAGNRILANMDVSEYPLEVFQKIQEGTKGSKLYSSLGNGKFDTVPAEDMVADVGWAYCPTFLDLNNDGWLDLYATAGFKSVKRGEPDG